MPVRRRLSPWSLVQCAKRCVRQCRTRCTTHMLQWLKNPRHFGSLKYVYVSRYGSKTDVDCCGIVFKGALAPGHVIRAVSQELVAVSGSWSIGTGWTSAVCLPKGKGRWPMRCWGGGVGPYEFASGSSMSSIDRIRFDVL
jgi:hypothetical protein